MSHQAMKQSWAGMLVHAWCMVCCMVCWCMVCCMVHGMLVHGMLVHARADLQQQAGATHNYCTTHQTHVLAFFCCLVCYPENTDRQQDESACVMEAFHSGCTRTFRALCMNCCSFFLPSSFLWPTPVDPGDIGLPVPVLPPVTWHAPMSEAATLVDSLD